MTIPGLFNLINPVFYSNIFWAQNGKIRLGGYKYVFLGDEEGCKIKIESL